MFIFGALNQMCVIYLEYYVLHRQSQEISCQLLTARSTYVLFVRSWFSPSTNPESEFQNIHYRWLNRRDAPVGQDVHTEMPKKAALYSNSTLYVK